MNRWYLRWTWILIAVIVVGSFVVINAPGISVFYYQLRYTHSVGALEPVAPFGSGDRLLVLAPHPDDESLCCAGLIQQALSAGAEVFVVYLTSGDGFEWDAVLLERSVSPGPRGMRALGERRMAEARAAAEVLGVPAENLTFLGYPDRGLMRLFLNYFTEPYRSSYTGVSEVPYEDALSPGAAYTGRNLERDLRQVAELVQPTVVLAPSPLDAHPDHQVAAFLAMRLFGEAEPAPRTLYWIVHGGVQWPLPKGWHRQLPLFPPPRGAGLPWQRVPLTPEEEARKEEAIRAHASQMQVLFRYMSAFVRTNELVSPLPLASP